MSTTVVSPRVDAPVREDVPERILVLAPSRSDAEACRRCLGIAELVHEVYEDDASLCAALGRPVAVLVVAEESLRGRAGDCLRAHLAEQPEWSAIPVVVLAGRQAAQRHCGREAWDGFGRVTLLERPVRMISLIGTLRLALRERREQLRIRDLLAERADSIAQRDEFLAMLGHELRNPLAAILICADVLDTVPLDTGRAAQCREIVGSQARQMKRLLDDLSDISRINRRKLGLNLERTDLRQVLSDVVSQVQGDIDARAQTLELEPNGAPVPLLADPMRLRQVFANLLTNANRYSPEGGRIRVKVRTERGLARITIRDNGAGMDERALSRIFEPFYQDRGATGGQAAPHAGPRAGLGIGLTLARSLVEMHARSITAHSAGPGRGSAFVVTLPLAGAAAGQQEPAARAPSAQDPGQPELAARPAGPDDAAAARRRILLIEDNQEFAGGLKYLLEARGHSVALAHDGVGGLRTAQACSPDVVVLDIGLPGLDGYAVARRLRRMPGLSRVRVIAVTGFGRVVDRESARDAGIDCHLVKPVSLADLEAAMAG